MLKDFTLSLELEPTENRVVQTAAIFWSHDVNTAKIYIELLRKGTPIILNKGVTVRVMMLFDDENKSEHIYTAKIEDELKGLVSITLEESMRMYVGQVTCGVYVDYQNEEKTDNGYFTFGMRRSLIDKDMPELQKLYVSDFEKALKKVDELESKNKEATDKLNSDIKDISKQIKDNDIVKINEFNELVEKTNSLSDNLELINMSILNSQNVSIEQFSRIDEDENEKTDYYVTTFKIGEGNELKTVYSENEMTAREFAFSENVNFVINGAAATDNAGLIVDGNVIDNEKINGSSTERDLMCILKDGTLTSFPLGKLPSDDELLSMGVKDSFSGFWTLVKDGSVITHPDVDDWNTQWNTKYQRQVIGQKRNGEIVVLTSEGKRTYANRNFGLTLKEVTEIMMGDYGCHFVYMLDGGGSTSLVLDQIFINQPTDEYFESQRKRPHFIYLENRKVKNSKSVLNMKNHLSDVNDFSKKNRMRLLYHNERETSGLNFINFKNEDSVTLRAWWNHRTEQERNTRINLAKKYLEVIVTDENKQNKNLMYLSTEQSEGVLGIRGANRYASPEFLEQKNTNLDNEITRSDFVYISDGKDGLQINVKYMISVYVARFADKTTWVKQIAHPFSPNFPPLYRQAGFSGGEYKWANWSKFIQ